MDFESGQFYKIKLRVGNNTTKDYIVKHKRLNSAGNHVLHVHDKYGDDKPNIIISHPKDIISSKKMKMNNKYAELEVIKEDAPMNSTGAAVAGTSGSASDVVIFNKPPTLRRKKIAGIEVHEMSNDEFHKYQLAKRNLRLHEANLSEMFGPGPILIQNELTGAIQFLRYGNCGNNKP